jgi:hypothetical protein
MIRGEWRHFRNEPPSAGPRYSAVILAIAAGAVAWSFRILQDESVRSPILG